ncbi:MAG: hypothetical protein ABI947_20870 [Chloroflexota bacterium]
MLPDTTPQSEVVIACDPNALTPDQQERWVQEIRELPNGWAWRLPSTPEMLVLVAEDLNMDRLCCPFVHYTLEIEPNRGPFWLRMTGADGVNAFLRMSFEAANVFDAQVAQAAGLNVSASPEINSVETVIDATGKLNARFANEGSNA